MTFQPLIAVTYDVEATCWYGKGSKQKSSIQLQAVGEARPPTCSQSPAAALPWVSRPQCAPTPDLGLHQPLTFLQPLGFAFYYVTDCFFPGDMFLLGAVQLEPNGLQWVPPKTHPSLP